MITFIVKANVKSGQTETLKRALIETAAFISANEPDFANYSYFNDDESQVTFINLVTDSAALGKHFQLSPQNTAMPTVMGALEVTSTEIYGDLSPEVEAIVQGMKPLRRTAQSGTFDRQIAVKEFAPA
ncbi:MAG: hypothetical protein KC419_11165 [Anaerolineales bacterium]|nr:hypothetical protein [Anaerolineales bacterium]MCA9929033.1 hypothetical protein [Anaerolineales bacterium]